MCSNNTSTQQGPPSKPVSKPPNASHPPVKPTRSVKLTDLSPDELRAFATFRELYSDTTQVHQVEQDGTTDDTNSVEEDSDDQGDALKAFLTKNQQKGKASAVHGKPLPGNINRLLSKSMAKK